VGEQPQQPFYTQDSVNQESRTFFLLGFCGLDLPHDLPLAGVKVVALPNNAISFTKNVCYAVGNEQKSH